MKQNLSTIWSKSLPLMGFISATIGFAADILQPLAPLTSYIFFSSAFASLSILVIFLIKSSLRANLTKAFIFTISMMVCSGGLYIFNDKEKNVGVASNLFPFIQNLQTNLGFIEKNMSEIKNITKDIQINTEKNIKATQEITKAVKSSTKEIVTSLNEIQKGFSKLSQSAGIISNPVKPEQFYHNARIQEQSGDYLNARKSYIKYFDFKLNFLDPHIRFQSFLKIQEGRAGAKEIYSIMYEKDPRPIVEFSKILLFEAPNRTQLLIKFIKDNPNFGPAYYQLSKEFTKERKGFQTLKDKRAELNALKKFSDLNEQGKFVKFFVDKEIVSKWIQNSESRILYLNKNADLLMPVSISVQPYTKTKVQKLCCKPFMCNTPKECNTKRCNGRDWKPIGDNDLCFRETKEITKKFDYWEIFIQINEKSTKPIFKISYDNQNSTFEKEISKLKKLSNSTEFFSYISSDKLFNKLNIFVSYLDSNRDKQGPFKLNFNMEQISLSFVEKLISNNININLPIKDDRISKAAGFPYNGVLNKLTRLEKDKLKLNLLSSAVALNQIKVVDKLLSSGAFVDGYKINTYSKSCNLTPLIIAVDNGRNEIAKKLIKEGANLQLSSFIGNVSDVASNRNNFEILKMISKKVVDKFDPCRCGKENTLECHNYKRSKIKILEINCGKDWWNVKIDRSKKNKLSINKIGDVYFEVQEIRNKTEVVKWESDFNEGIINTSSGIAEVTKDNYGGKLVGEKFSCRINTKFPKVIYPKSVKPISLR